MLQRGLLWPSNYHRRPRRDHRASTTSFHGAVLGLPGCFVTWPRPWAAFAALLDALCSLVGCKDTMVIATVTAVDCMAGCGFLEGTCLGGCFIATGVWGPFCGSIARL